MNLVARFALIIFVALAIPRLVFANRFNTETSFSGRAAGMGNAVINTERGPHSQFYNPANLAAKGEPIRLEPLNVQVDSNQPYYSTIMGGKFVNFQNLSSLLPYLDKNRDVYVGARYSVFPNFTMRGLSLGMLYEVNQGAEKRSTDDALRIKARNRFAPTVSLALRLFWGMLRIGGNFQYLTVGNVDKMIPADQQSENIDFASQIESGSGFSKNVGFTLTSPTRYLPSASLVFRDIGGTSFTNSPRVPFGSKPVTELQPMTWDFALAQVVYLARRIEWKMEVNYKDYTNRIPGSYLQRIFAGSEFVLWDILKLRMGLAHGYWSAGLGINTERMNLDIATYSDELEGRLRTREDRRVVLHYTFALFQ